MGAIWLGSLTIAASFLISLVAGRCGYDVSARFLERGNVIPSRQLSSANTSLPQDSGPRLDVRLTKESLSAWLVDATTSQYVRPYVFWVIPLDFVFMGLLGAFMVTGSLTFAEAIAWPRPLSQWQGPALLIAPIVYVVSDAVEDIQIIRILLGSNQVDGSSFATMRWWTGCKTLFATIALTQTIGLGFWSLWFSKM
jgi:hypothetical protein